MKKIVKLIGLLIIMTLILSILPNATFSQKTSPDTTFAFAASSGSSIDSKITGSIILYVGSPVAYVNGVEKRIDPVNLEVAPVIIKNAEMVPVRFIAESLGGKTLWDQKSKTASIILNDKSYNFTQGSSVMISGNSRYSLSVPVQAYKGRTFVPLDKFTDIVGKKAIYERGLIIISNSEIAFDKVRDKSLISEWISKLSYLPVVGTREKLISLLKEQENIGTLRYGGVLMKSMDTAEMATTQNAAMAAEESKPEDAAPAPVAGVSTETRADDYSTTNVQVQGVDEGDIVKTDGNCIYQVNKQRVVIVKADPAEKMKVMSIINYADKNLVPLEIYLQGNKLIVIGSSQVNFPIYKEEGGVKKEIYPSRRSMHASTKAIFYDMTDKGNIKLIREVELEGGYVSSRKIGASLYLVANDYVDYYSIQNGEANATPTYMDSRLNVGAVNVGYNSIRYFPGVVESNYMMVAGINIEGNDAANVTTYLGAGQNIYASAENLYVALTDYSRANPDNSYEESTQLYKFAMKDAKLTYLCKGTVPGVILNQFSMDESGSFFRIATTKGNTRATDEGISKNALYILDSMLSITGKVEELAPGEKIYSVRFMGDRAYVVTFKTVDPLFVIDLKDPTKPTVLGALKIPGYSDYLHPYDENHIIGFGKDTTEIKGQAYYLGLKIALFDVTDVNNPKQKFSEMIGARGTDSELLRNHKALLFSKDKNLLAFPVTLMERNDNSGTKDSLQYGQFTFQGALVYNLDLKTGFKLKGRITHLSNTEYLKAGNNWYDSDKSVQRIIYVGDKLYTLSNGRIKANAISDLKEKGSITIP
jgi:inhibitor of cysteine peptidase